MIINANGQVTKDLFEKGLSDLSSIPFTLHVEKIPTEQELKLNSVNIFYHSEPNEYFHHHSWIFNNRHSFSKILTWNRMFIQTFPNAVETLFGTCTLYNTLGRNWLPEDNHKIPGVSFLRGNKQAPIEGHKFRWDLWGMQNHILQTTEFLPCTSQTYAQTVEEEEEWHKPRTKLMNTYTHCIAVENSRHPNYFTEKIIDCFALKTIPVYFGCPNIERWFNPKGMLIVDSVPELIYTINNINLQKHYEDNYDAVIDNYNRSKEFWCWTNNVKKSLEKMF